MLKQAGFAFHREYVAMERAADALEAAEAEKKRLREAPKTARDLTCIIRDWLEKEPASDWGDFEKGLAGLVYAEKETDDGQG